jgi:hypothetical protein
MSMTEVEDHFPGEWVLLKDPELDEQGWVIRGQVIFHDPERSAVFREANRLPEPRYFTVWYAGQAPSGLDLVL